MKLYTIQSEKFWEENKNNLYLHNNPDYIMNELIYPYRWMYNQMITRISNCDKSMIWVWSERPDLRRSGYLNKGEKGVLLELDIDEEQVLFSDFYMWHNVLMDLPIKLHNDENINKELSWERIFDFNICLEIYKQSEESLEEHQFKITKQGVTSKVHINNVKLVKRFISR